MTDGEGLFKGNEECRIVGPRGGGEPKDITGEHLEVVVGVQKKDSLSGRNAKSWRVTSPKLRVETARAIWGSALTSERPREA